ncbi:MAG: acetyl-CoA decarbonylase/synthase complex subunit alpha/beta [Kiritimatiellia bacterium]|jgi:acetyl-CoA synthase|nr:acetyl-CoA decarbonylase/synthase complex subunit alpha/beta [Kiritimatiellia bacterium]MDP6631655.1 acetyl-CoA decarbonylase/synthase complex subunit alpha/beta [Kiritimatiellia bacterium]MDP6810753.1 acetyl-CoA decarbonylase/synthase complex subunit alpha/beta [Kiritimatiellia bacterium]MDP7022628.1 acetyl-CoA decarbonylase/synthase complex subunit alpha/beta [Kiritimatiellia bacterium]
MSKIIAGAAIRGAHEIVSQAEAMFERARQEKSEDTKIEFPDTAYYLPMAYALMELKIETVGQLKPVLEHARDLLAPIPADDLWFPYLGHALDSGIATLLAEEIICAGRYLFEEEPQDGCNGFFTDTILRTLGIQLVDGRMPGFAAILGAAPTNEIAVNIVRELQKRQIMVFAGSSTDGVSIIDQLEAENVEMGWDTYIVPFGRDTISTIYPLNWAMRAAMTFGGIDPGKARDCLMYCKNRVFAFAVALGEVDDFKYATAAGAINMGFPAIADTEIPEILPTGICTYEHVVHELDHDNIVPRCIEVRGVKVTVSEVDIPVSFSAAFEGERVRKEDMQLQFGGKYSDAFEFVHMREMDDVEDGKVEVIGPDVESVELGDALPLGLYIEVAGREMQQDFESILERQVHHFINYAMGAFHMGQRDLIWVRISKDAFEAGFRLKHFGTILHARIHDVYGKIVDKVQVTVISDPAKVKELMGEAKVSYAERDARVSDMTDESVEEFYSCSLCQSFAPNHICVISPERLGLCGAYNWLDGKAAYQIDPSGGNQPILKGKLIDQDAGIWEGINEFVYNNSNRTIDNVSIYSVIQAPMTSCGCFECILALVPEANGFMIVNREFPGETPCGMKFSTLAGCVGGGNQTPGFLGVGRLYVLSRKFLYGDGGLKRLVWMPKELKSFFAERFIERATEEGVPDLMDKIADETVATTGEELVEYLTKTGHPALEMEAVF